MGYGWIEARNGSNGIIDGLSVKQYLKTKQTSIKLKILIDSFTCNSPNDDKSPAPYAFRSSFSTHKPNSTVNQYNVAI